MYFQYMMIKIHLFHEDSIYKQYDLFSLKTTLQIFLEKMCIILII